MGIDIMNLLKITYKEGIESLLFRNSPILRDIPKDRVSGKEYRFQAIGQRSPATSSNYNIAKTLAETNSTKNVEWKIDLTQQQLFSVFNVNSVCL